MGYAERSYSYGGSGGFGSFGGRGGFGIGRFLTPWVTRLLVANGVVFLLVNVLGLLPLGEAARLFGFSPARLLVHPWTPLTYMFVHGGFWHVFVNMLVLFFFGPPLERAWGGKEFLRFYLVAGLGGALFSVLLIPLIGTPTVIGASGALYGLLLAFAMTWPEAPIYVWGILPIKAKWFVGILGGVSLYFTFIGRGGNVASWAHLGGLATGFAYLKYGDRVGWTLGRLGRKLDRARGGLRVEPTRTPPSVRTRRRGPRLDEDSLDRVNAILDKIREQGMSSLTPEEREFLDDMSRKYRSSSP